MLKTEVKEQTDLDWKAPLSRRRVRPLKYIPPKRAEVQRYLLEGLLGSACFFLWPNFSLFYSTYIE